MQRIAVLNLLLNELARRHRIVNLRLGAHGAVNLSLRDGTEMTFEYVPSSDRFFIYSVVAALPKAEAACAALCRSLLDMNCMEQHTGCGTMALDDSKNEVLFQMGMFADKLTCDDLNFALQRFLADRQKVVERLEDSNAEMPLAIQPPSSDIHVARLAKSGGSA